MQSFTFIALLTLLCSCASLQHDHQLPPLQTVSHVDLHRYVGLWYEIGRYPNSFQKRCEDSTAMYTLRPDGQIDVVNRCRDEQDGRLREASGRAWVVDKNSNAQLRVSFFWPFSGDYWIIDLGQEYEYAVVGTPNRQYLWILSRTPEMRPEILEKIVQNVEKQGFDRSNLLLHDNPSIPSMVPQAGLSTANGVQTTLCSGSYAGYGLHENAVRSSYQAVAYLRKAAL